MLVTAPQIFLNNAMFYIMSLSENVDDDVIPGHKYHCKTWWGHSHRLHSVLTAVVSSILLNTRHRSDRGSGDDMDTVQLQSHNHLTVNRLKNRNILDSRGDIRVRKKYWTVGSDFIVAVTMKSSQH